MATTFEEFVNQSSRIVKKQWSTPTELAQELFTMLSSSGSSSLAGINTKLVTPTYGEVSKNFVSSYPENAAAFANNSRIDFHGLKNPTKPTFPEVPPITKRYSATTLNSNGGNGSGGSVNIDAAVSFGQVTSSEGAAHAFPGRVDVLITYNAKKTAELKNIKVLNANESFKVPVGTEVIVFFDQYAMFPVWL
jgi:hypothetical protein